MVTKPAKERSTADYENFTPSEKITNKWLVRFSIFSTLTILIAIAIGFYWQHQKDSKNTHNKNPSMVSRTAPAGMKSYHSSTLGLTFDYPITWAISDPGSGVIRATSPSMQLLSAEGQSVNGKVILTLRGTANDLPGFNEGDAIAPLVSQRISYSNPSFTQHGTSYISFLTYSSTNQANALDAIYITEDTGYVKNQQIPESDLIKNQPIVSLTFTSDNGSPISLSAAAWSYPSFSSSLLTILKSLSIS